MRKLIIYRLELSQPAVNPALSEGSFICISGAAGIVRHAATWWRNLGSKETLRTALKVLTGKRVFYGVVKEKKIIQSGWANIGFCRYYPVEQNSVVLGTLWTTPEYRGRGLAPAALSRVMAMLCQRGYHRFYIDAETHNLSSQRMIEKTGFQQLATT